MCQGRCMEISAKRPPPLQPALSVSFKSSVSTILASLIIWSSADRYGVRIYSLQNLSFFPFMLQGKWNILYYIRFVVSVGRDHRYLVVMPMVWSQMDRATCHIPLFVCIRVWNLGWGAVHYKCKKRVGKILWCCKGYELKRNCGIFC